MDHADHEKLPRRKRWGFRIAAVLLGLFPFFVVELGLRVLGLPLRKPPVDPYMDLGKIEPLFVRSKGGLDNKPASMEIGSQRLHLFQPASFSNPKPPDTFRVFALGGSTTQGEPFQPETAFPKWLEIALQTADPSQRFEVINCGGLSYASYRVLAILREVIAYEPDLIVVYTGHNEYLERRTYQRSGGGAAMTSNRFWSQLRIAQALSSLIPRQERETVKDLPSVAREVDALLDYQGGLEDYVRGDAWRLGVPEHFGWNVQEMIASCGAANVPIIMVSPVSNLRDCPPFKTESSPELDESQTVSFDSQWNTALGAKSASEAFELASAAIELDREHAGAHYLLGSLWLQPSATSFHQGTDSGDDKNSDTSIKALRHLVAAKDFDVCPLRCPSELLQQLQDVLIRHDIATLDAQALFAERSEFGIVGNRWLVDHIHPTVEGHQLLGLQLAKLCLERQYIESSFDEWEDEISAQFSNHLAGLGEAYFQRGQQRLEGLRLWTQGRAKKLKPEFSVP